MACRNTRQSLGCWPQAGAFTMIGPRHWIGTKWKAPTRPIRLRQMRIKPAMAHGAAKKECHGWDYLGKDGIYAKGSHFTGIAGINGAIGKPVDQIAATLRDANHPYTVEMTSDEEMLRVAAFVSRGQVDMRSFLDYETRTVNKGDVNRGREIFQTTCAACHGFDGRLMDWGSDGNHNYVGTEAVEVPDEVMNKILNAHTGVQMINLRAFPFEYAIDVIAYAATLPLDPPKE